jgi:hypothetical protein
MGNGADFVCVCNHLASEHVGGFLECLACDCEEFSLYGTEEGDSSSGNTGASISAGYRMS